MILDLFYKACDFGCEIFLFLFNALALFKAGEAVDYDFAADGLRNLCDVLLNGNFVALDKGLLEEAVFLIKLAYATQNHLLDDSFGL